MSRRFGRGERRDEAPDLFRCPLFAETFAAFLRVNPSRWRLRRTDTFSPLDINLAERTVTLDARIDRQLLTEFINLYGAALGIPNADGLSVQRVTAYIPFVSHPKTLLLSSRHSSNEGRGVTLQRYDDSRILARDLLARLFNAEHRSGRNPREQDQHGLRLMSSALLFNDPHRLKERLEVWCKAQGQPTALQKDLGLTYEALLTDWIREEGNQFASGLGDPLVYRLRPFVSAYFARAPYDAGPGTARPEEFVIPREFRPDGLAFFPTIESLLLHGIQDVLKLTIETASGVHSSPSTASDRAHLMTTPDALASRVAQSFAAVPLLTRMLGAHLEETPSRDFLYYLDRWVPYAVVTFQLGVPFRLSFADTFSLQPLEGVRLSWRDQLTRFWATRHQYPLALKDALSVHVEVLVNEPELNIKRTRVMKRVGSRGSPVPEVFGQKRDASKRLTHRYSSKRPLDTLGPATKADGDERVFLEVLLKLTTSIKAAYLSAALAFLAVGAFVLYVCAHWIYNGGSADAREVALASGVVATTLALWLITTQYRLPVIHRKLRVARYALYASLALTIVPLIALGVWTFAGVDHLHRPTTVQTPPKRPAALP